tara:strand:- start:12 stop:4454 length:4443 start_codon:yes stop_codon:yes gene_type:complete
MGATYTRQSSYSDGDVITAAHTNDEFNQILAAFQATTGHTHDGTANEGGPITKLLGNTLTFGAGTVGTDITITFDGETADGELKWMEDEDYFEFSDDILIASTEKLQFRDTAIYINSSTDGQLDLVADGAVLVDTAGDITLDADGGDIVLKDGGTQFASLTNTSGDLIIKSGSTTAMTFSGANVTFAGTVTIGSAGISEAELEILDGATVTTDELNILDGVTSTASELNLVDGSSAGTIVNSKAVIYGSSGEVNATTLQIAGTSITSTAAELNILDGVTSTAAELNILDGVTSTAAELNILDGVTSTATELNIVDGDTSATSTTLADADRVVVNDNGTMVQVALTDFETYFESALDTLSNVTTVGALNSGSITSGFGTIDTGSSTITTTGLITGGSLDIDDVVIDGTTIGHTDDTDLITVADGLVTVAGEISVTTLDIGGTNVTSTAAELNILDGVTSTTAELNILDGVTSTTAELNILDGVTSTTAELNLVDGSSAGTIVNSKAVVYGSSGEVNATTLQIGGTSITSTAAELNILDGVTSTTAELNILDGVTSTAAELNLVDGITAGTVSASKAVIADSNKDVSGFRNLSITGDLTVSGDDITMNTNTSGHIMVAEGSKFTPVAVSGDISLASNGAVTIANSAVETAMVNANVITGQTAETSLDSNNDTLLFHDNSASALRKVTVGSLSSALGGLSEVSGDSSPQLGGDLDVNGNDITGSTITLDSAGDIILDADGTDITLKDGGTTFANLKNSSGELVIQSGSTPTTAMTFSGANVTLAGNLTVSGTTTTVNSTTVNLNDHNIVLDSGNDTSAVVNGAGITIEGGSGDDATFSYNTTGPKFELKLGSSHEDLQVDQLIAASLDISGNVDVDGTLETDALSIASTTVTSTAAELNILDGVTATTAELNILDGVTASAADINLIDGITNGTVIASKAIITDSNKDISGGRNITITGELDAATLDISGNADIDGTLETDALSINGTTVTSTAAELNILDGVTSTTAELNILDGVTSTTAELNILDGVTSTTAELNLLDGSTAGTVVASKAVVVDSNKDIASFRNVTLTGELDAATLDISGNADIDGTLEAAAITVGGTALNTVIAGVTVTDATNAAHVLVTDNESTDEDNLITFVEGATSSTGNVGLEMDGNLTYNPSTGRLTATQLAGTLQTAAQANITSLGTLTTLTVDDITINDSTISDSGDFTLDVGGDITFDAAGNDFKFQDNGTEFFRISNSSSNAVLKPTVSAKDIIFQRTNGDEIARVKSSTDTFDVQTGKLAINGTAITSTAAELNILDGVTSTAAELNILDGVTSTTAELNILDGVTSTAAELNLVDGITAGTVSASKAVIVDSNKDVTGFRNVTTTGDVTVGDDASVAGRATGNQETDNDGNFDLATANFFKCTPSGNFTLTLSNPAEGQSGTIMLINTGGHTVSADASVAINADILTALSTAGTYMLTYYCSAASGDDTILVGATGALT